MRGACLLRAANQHYHPKKKLTKKEIQHHSFMRTLTDTWTVRDEGDVTFSSSGKSNSN